MKTHRMSSIFNDGNDLFYEKKTTPLYKENNICKNYSKLPSSFETYHV